jgi:hypothetical protein
VAVDDWTVDQLKERARTSIESTGEQLDPEVFERFANRLSYVEGDFGDGRDLRARGEGDRGLAAAGLLPRDPARSSSDGSSRGSPRRA